MQIIGSVKSSPLLVITGLAISDVRAVSVSLALAVTLRSMLGPVAVIQSYTQMWPLILLIMGTFATFG